MPVVTFEAGPDELRSLEEWLRDTDGLRGRVRLEQRAPRPGHLGAEPPALLVAVETEASATVLVRTVEFWLRMRGSDIALKLRVGSQVNQMELLGEIDVERVVRQVEALLRDALKAATE